MTNNKKVLIMAGGTGGHIFPALGIAHHLQTLGVTVEWLGTKKGMEVRIDSADRHSNSLYFYIGSKG